MGIKGEARELTPQQAITKAQELLDWLNASKTRLYIQDFEIAGSYRREAEVVNDLDIIIYANKEDWHMIMQSVAIEGFIKTKIALGDKKASFILDSGLQVDIVTAEWESRGAMLLYFTGSQQFNIALRSRAKKMGYTLNQEILMNNHGARVAATEEAILDTLGLSFIPPTERSIVFNDFHSTGKLFDKHKKG